MYKASLTLSLPDFFQRLNLAPADAEKLAAGTHIIDRIIERDIKIKPIKKGE